MIALLFLMLFVVCWIVWDMIKTEKEETRNMPEFNQNITDSHNGADVVERIIRRNRMTEKADRFDKEELDQLGESEAEVIREIIKTRRNNHRIVVRPIIPYQEVKAGDRLRLVDTDDPGAIAHIDVAEVSYQWDQHQRVVSSTGIVYHETRWMIISLLRTT